MNMFRSLSLAVAGAVALSSSAAFADAITLDASKVGQAVTLNYNGFSGGTTVAGLTGSTTLTLTSINGTSYNFDYSVTNTTSDPVNSRISSFGFNTNPDIASAASTGTYSYVNMGGNLPNGLGTIDVCFKAGGSNSCSGSGGVLDGQTGSGTLALNFASAPTALTLSDFFLRYQSITGAGSVTSATGTGTFTTSGGTSTGGGSTGGTPVPEPGMIGLFGLSLIGVALLRSRRRTPRGRMPQFATA